MDAFVLHGVKSVTMDDIAMMLGISKRTLYEIFEDKESLLIECLSERQNQMNSFVCEVLNTSSNVLEVILKCYKKSIEDYHEINTHFFDEIKKYPKVCELARENKKKNGDDAVDFFEKGIEQGIFRRDVNFAIMHSLVHEQMDLLMNSETFKKYSFLEVYESIILTFIRGVATEKGAAILDDFLVEYRKKDHLI